MKKLLALGFWLLAINAFGADVKLAWDAPVGDEYGTAVRIYEVVGSNYILKGEVPSSVATFTVVGVQPGRHVYIARSYSETWKLESPDSNKAITPNLNVDPKNLVWTVVIP